MNKDYVIIAPHVDDELIGCFQQIISSNVKKIIYVEKVNLIRKDEAIELCNDYNLKFDFLDGNIKWLFDFDKSDNYLIPSPIDRHNLHKECYHIMSREYSQISVYSTYMDDWFIKESVNPERKKLLLDKYYPTQKDLWAQDARYYLFEGLVKLEL